MKSTPARIALIVTFAAIFGWVGCNQIQEPPFEGGIRMTAEESFESLPGTNQPVPGVLTSGQMANQVGPGTGYLSSFSGATDLDGVHDEPSAITNANWVVTWDFTPTGPDCYSQSPIDYVGTQGAVFNDLCVILDVGE